MKKAKKGKRYRVIDDNCGFFKKGDIVVALGNGDLTFFTKEEDYEKFGTNFVKYDIHTNYHALKGTEIEEIEEEKNMENYIVINGKKAELTKEQLKALGIEKENPFDVKCGELAYCINGYFGIDAYKLWEDNDKNTYCPCKDEEFVKERAKKEQLSRLLWKFANENNDEPTEEEVINNNFCEWFIRYDVKRCRYEINCSYNFFGYGVQLFKTREVCQRALDEVVIPFMRGDLK